MSTALIAERRARALESLTGLSVGDAFGERLFAPAAEVGARLGQRAVPPGPWAWTDDTAMAVSVVEVLLAHDAMPQEELAQLFAKAYRREPARGYGQGAHQVLSFIAQGVPWRTAASKPFGPQGSFGNGSAMRVAPLGAYFADDLEALVRAAAASSEVTHLHPEAQAGAIATALAAAYAHYRRYAPNRLRGRSLMEFVLEGTPASEVRRGIEAACSLPGDATVEGAVRELGSGARVTAQDTVPFCMWAAQRHLDRYDEALWTTVAGLGDRDTTCAIVGGIVVLATGPSAIPAPWLAAREPLPAMATVR